MITNGQKTSLLVQSQLPAFIRDNPDYNNFVYFIEAYYEWLEQNNNTLDRTKNLLSYKDVDQTTDEFIKYYVNDFLPNFPNNTLINKQTAIKVARQLYQNKGTPSSYQFLFRVLYNSDFEIFYTKDSVLKASDGIWYVAKSLKLASLEPALMNIQNYRLFGETTKSIATVENSVKSSTKTEVFISNIERLFQSGEFVRVVDNRNQDVYFLNGVAVPSTTPGAHIVRAKIVGQISQVKIGSAAVDRGLFYEVGDPVIIYGGLNSANGHGAIAEVGSITTGSIQNINLLSGGYGYSLYPNTVLEITNAPTAQAIVASIDPSTANSAVLTYIPSDEISLKENIRLGNSNFFFANVVLSDINTTLINAFSFQTLTTYPISSVLVLNGGGGISKKPVVTAISTITDEAGNTSNLADLGMLAPIQIKEGGHGYRVNDVIKFTGGSGYGAYANVTSVNSNGSITTITYVKGTLPYPAGGMGYVLSSLPNVAVYSSNTQAYGANISVPGIIGSGASFDVVVDRIGSVTTINLLDQGEDYISTPNVSLRIQDIVVSNVVVAYLPENGDVVYQGANVAIPTYHATINSISLLAANSNPQYSLWNLRVFEYNSNPNPTQKLSIIGRPEINMVMANVAYQPLPSVPSVYNQYGVRNYGNALAKANASFLNGLVLSPGHYLSSRGQLSSFDVLQSTDYNNFTYQITVQKEISKYKNVLLSLLHPTGLKMIGRYGLYANGTLTSTYTQDTFTGYPLSHYTDDTMSGAIMTADFENTSNNIIQLTNLNGANLANIFHIDPINPKNSSVIQILPPNGPYVSSDVIAYDTVANTVIVRENTILSYNGVAVIEAFAYTNTINILSLTGAYDLMNNGVYSDPNNPLKDIVYVGDTILIDNNDPQVVTAIDYNTGNGIIYVANTWAVDAYPYGYLSVNRTFNTNKVSIFTNADVS